MTEKQIKNKTCPQCGKPAEHMFRPFCSKRCQQLDLGKWFNESYSIPGEETIPANDEDEGY